MSINRPSSRRTFLKQSSATVATGALAGALPAAAALSAVTSEASAASANVIAAENAANSSTWSSNFQVATPGSAVQGFARKLSVNVGESIALSISGPDYWWSGDEDTATETVEVELYRLG